MSGPHATTAPPRFWGPFARIAASDAEVTCHDSIYDGFLAAYYDVVTHGYAGDLDEYAALAAAYGRRVLDVGCGTGRVGLRLAERGAEVVGLDRSADMLGRMERHAAALPPEAAARVRLVEGDAASFDLDGHFDLILCSAFTFLPTAEDRLAFFGRARRHLAETGALAFDFLDLGDAEVAALDGALDVVELPLGDSTVLTVYGAKFTEDRRHWWWNFDCQFFVPGRRPSRHLGASTFARLDGCELDRLLAEAGFAVVERRRQPQTVARVTAGRALYLCEPRRRTTVPVWHPFTPPAAAPALVVLSDGEGRTVRDTRGRTFIDAAGGVWSAHCGLGHPAIAEAMAAQVRRLPAGGLFGMVSHEPALALGRRLLDLTPGDLAHVFFTATGSEAADLSIKLARLHFDAAGARRREILYLDRSYHGSCFGGMGMSGLMPAEPYGPGVGALTPLPTPVPPPRGGAAAGDPAARALDALAAVLSARGDGVAALVLEPVLGSAGVIALPDRFLRGAARLCRRHGVLLVVDEVATGFGRTGRWFACEHSGLRPDILLLAKGITAGHQPLGAVLFSDAVARPLLRAGRGIDHGSSAAGHPVACAAALASIDVIDREGLVERAEARGRRFGAALAALRDGRRVVDVRGLGLMWAVETDPAAAPPGPLHARMRDAGVLAYGFADGLSFFPALTVTDGELDRIAAALARSLAGIGDGGSGEGASGEGGGAHHWPLD
ncbi:aminotransferase class III-fold pyridoxal phosphate-dependent enzyme [Azospirillum sp. ST 5-10]|uniref:aminotransferase class III-fold pyridoxal phosphate-dependent enzyme n=1 Tax=unclassified Azospirillum TaxID=2630922 RepID=UPI003F4A5168